MHCRVCGKDIGQSRFCFSCGWLNGQVELCTYSLKISRFDDAVGILRMENQFNSEVSVNITLEDAAGVVSFTPELGVVEANKRQNIKITGGDALDIKFIFNLRDLRTTPSFRFKLRFESDDDSPALQQESIFQRPYKTEQKRIWEREVYVEILEPSRLIFDKQMMLFDDVRTECFLNVKNAGQLDITLNRSNFTVIPGFDVYLENSADSLVINAGGRARLKVKVLQTNTEQLSVMTVDYTTSEERISEDIILYIRKRISEIPERLYQKIVAVDFGTSKTASAFLDVLNLHGLDGLVHEVQMIKLDETKNETPSCIAYRGRRIYIGTPAEGQREDESVEFISSMKRHLHKDKIETRKNNKVVERDTREVITSYLSEIREKIKNEIQNMDNNKYVFTLPVLDNDQDGTLFDKQKEVTLACAQAAGFGDASNIQTITEPEAAMYYIINSIKDNPESWGGCNLQNEDRICVFDYGGGTLDICFGTYKLSEDGKPTVDNPISIGMYSNANGRKISLGGDRLDSQMAFSISLKYGDEIILKNQKFDDNDNFVSAEFDDNSPYKTSSWRVYTDAIKVRKEELSKNWLSSKDSGVVVNDDHSINLTPEIFSDVVYDDLDYAINGMQNTLQGEKNLKYIFMVGGTSLIYIIKERLQRVFPTVKIFNAYDFSPLGTANGEYEKIRQDAVYPVVRGAAISYMTTVTSLFPIYLKIAPVNYQGNSSHYILYNKDESFYRQVKIVGSQVCWGEWLITGSMDGQRYYKMGSFIIEKPTDNPPLAITLISKITKKRELKISYLLGKESSEEEVRDVEVYV